jgi:hypothetical protein
LVIGREALEENKKIEELEYKKSYEAYKESIGGTFAFILRNTQARKEDYGIVQIKMEKGTEVPERGLGDRLL